MVNTLYLENRTIHERMFEECILYQRTVFYKVMQAYLLQSGMKEAAECLMRESKTFPRMGSFDPVIYGKAVERVNMLWDHYIFDKQEEMIKLEKMYNENLYRNFMIQRQFTLVKCQSSVKHKSSMTCKSSMNNQSRKIMERKRSRRKFLSNAKQGFKPHFLALAHTIRKRRLQRKVRMHKKEVGSNQEIPDEIIQKILSQVPLVRYYNACYRHLIMMGYWDTLLATRRESCIPFIGHQYFDRAKDDLFQFRTYYFLNRCFVSEAIDDNETQY